MADVALIRFCDRKNTFYFMVISNLPDIVIFISIHTFGLQFSHHSLQIFVDRSARPYAPCPRLTILSQRATWEVLCTSVNCHTLLAHSPTHARTRAHHVAIFYRPVYGGAISIRLSYLLTRRFSYTGQERGCCSLVDRQTNTRPPLNSVYGYALTVRFYVAGSTLLQGRRTGAGPSYWRAVIVPTHVVAPASQSSPVLLETNLLFGWTRWDQVLR